MSAHRCTSTHPIDLASGRVLAPGESADLDPHDPHHAALIADGSLMALAERAPRSSPSAPEHKEADR